MNPWTSYLQALHSALIDELVELAPDPKPVLKMPERFNSWILPEATLTSVCIIPTEFKDHPLGFGVIALSELAVQRLGLSAHDFWSRIYKKAGVEFHRRNIKPITSDAMTPSQVAKDLGKLTRMIWTPVMLAEGEECYFGVGIE